MKTQTKPSCEADGASLREWCLVIINKMSLFGMLIGAMGLLAVIIPGSDKDRALLFGAAVFMPSVGCFVLTSWLGIKSGVMSLRKWSE